MNLICFSDSITHARHFAECDRWPSILQHKLSDWKPGAVSVYNRGVGGHTTAQGLDRFQEDVLPLLPGLVLLEFGFNDANTRDWARKTRVGIDEFAANLAEFHRAITERGGRSAFILNHTIDRDDAADSFAHTYAGNYARYHERIREVAKQCESPAIDLPAMMKQRGVDLAAFLSEDGLHLSVEGNHVYADMIFEAVIPLLDDAT